MALSFYLKDDSLALMKLVNIKKCHYHLKPNVHFSSKTVNKSFLE